MTRKNNSGAQIQGAQIGIHSRTEPNKNSANRPFWINSPAKESLKPVPSLFACNYYRRNLLRNQKITMAKGPFWREISTGMGPLWHYEPIFSIKVREIPSESPGNSERKSGKVLRNFFAYTHPSFFSYMDIRLGYSPPR